MISSTLHNQQIFTTDPISHYKFNVPNYNYSIIHKNNDSPVIITADHIESYYPNTVVFSGNVDINQSDSHLQADKVELHQNQLKNESKPIRTVCALGNISYKDHYITLNGLKGWINLNTEDANIWKGNYHIVDYQVRGKANIMKQRGKKRYAIFESSSFTFCPYGYNTWKIMSSKIIFDRKEEIVKIWNARFKLGSLPIFYIPYLQIPIGNKHLSGFLIPNIKYSTSNYFEFYLPYYWKIAPNIDITITPHYMHKYNNIMWENEFRYLTHNGNGLITFNYLPFKKIKNQHPTIEKEFRSLFYWQHMNVLDLIWRFNIDYVIISDSYYFNDFDLKYKSMTNGYTTQKFSVGYAIDKFDATFAFKQFQIFKYFNSNIYENYAARPQLDINWYYNNLRPFNIHIYLQAVHFVNLSSSTAKSIRLHFEPVIDYSLMNNWINLNTQAKLMVTHYRQKRFDLYHLPYNDIYKNSINRVLPQFKLDGKLIFERTIRLMKNYTQTLEPRIVYLYIPYRDQSKIQNHDSSYLQFNYNALFRDKLYSGFDRIASANKLTTGITMRIYDDAVIEHFNISLGYIYGFTNSRTGDNIIKWKDNDKNGLLAFVGDTYLYLADRWGLRMNLLYERCLNNIAMSSNIIEYRRDQDHTVQLAYRYINPEYIQITQPNYFLYKKYKNEGISQIGGITNWSIANHLLIAGTCYFDTHIYHPVNQTVSLQYNSCCYSIHINYEYKLNYINNTNQVKYDKILGLNIELRNLSSIHNSGTEQVLHSNLLYSSLLQKS